MIAVARDHTGAVRSISVGRRRCPLWEQRVTAAGYTVTVEDARTACTDPPPSSLPLVGGPPRG